MSCGRLPPGFGEPLPRLVILPGDPPALRRELLAMAATEEADDVPPPTEEPQ